MIGCSTPARAQHARRHIPFLQIHDQRPFAFHCQPLFGEGLHHLFQLIGKLAFTHGQVEVHFQDIVDSLCLLAPFLDEESPQRSRFPVAYLQLPQALPGLVLQCGIFLQCLVEAGVESDQFGHGIGFYLFHIGPPPVRGQQLPKVGTPVARVVDADAAPAQKGVNPINSVADSGGTQMRDGEGFGQVG